MRARIEEHSRHQDKLRIEFHKADYRSSFGKEQTSYDLLISLSSGLISQACGSYPKKGGVLFVNNEHYDASMAYVDPEFKLVGIFKTSRHYVESEEVIHSHFATPKEAPLHLTW